jgi:hypothetical protein
MPCIKAKDSEATTEEAIVADQEHQEVVVETTTGETVVVSKGTKNLINTPKIEGTQTILKINPKANKQRPLTKGATTIRLMTGEDQILRDNKTGRENGVQIVKKAHTIRHNVGATERKQSTTSTTKKMNSPKTKMKNLSVTLFILSSRQKTKI